MLALSLAIESKLVFTNDNQDIYWQVDLLTPTLVSGFKSQGPPRQLYDASYIRIDISFYIIAYLYLITLLCKTSHAEKLAIVVFALSWNQVIVNIYINHIYLRNLKA